MQDLKGQLIEYIDYDNSGLTFVYARGMVIDVQIGDHYPTVSVLANGRMYHHQIGTPACELIQTSYGWQIYNRP